MDQDKVNELYVLLKKQFIVEVLQIMNNTCPEYLTNEGKGFLDGISTSGEMPDIVSKEQYDLNDNALKDVIRKKNSIIEELKSRKWYERF